MVNYKIIDPFWYAIAKLFESPAGPIMFLIIVLFIFSFLFKLSRSVSGKNLDISKSFELPLRREGSILRNLSNLIKKKEKENIEELNKIKREEYMINQLFTFLNYANNFLIVSNPLYKQYTIQYLRRSMQIIGKFIKMTKTLKQKIVEERRNLYTEEKRIKQKEKLDKIEEKNFKKIKDKFEIKIEKSEERLDIQLEKNIKEQEKLEKKEEKLINSLIRELTKINKKLHTTIRQIKNRKQALSNINDVRERLKNIQEILITLEKIETRELSLERVEEQLLKQLYNLYKAEIRHMR